MNRTIWRIGHILSRKKLIDAACQMRDISHAWDENNSAARANALDLLDQLYNDGAISKSLRQELGNAIAEGEIR